MTTLHLYELADRHRLIFDAIEDAGGELTPELEAALDQLGHDLESKVDGCCVRVAELGSAAAVVQAEIDRLKMRQASFVNQQARLKDYVRACLERADLARVETKRFTVRLQNSPPSAKWTGDPDTIPAGFRREKHSVEFDGKSALAAFKSGDELPAGIEVRQSKHLVIK